MGGVLLKKIKGVGSMNHRVKINQKVFEIFWIFILGSFIGFMYESILCIIQRGYLESRQGVIYGPLTPIYGVGAVILMLLLYKRKNIISIFFLSAIAGGFVEYLFSLFQQFFFGTISWDYHNRFNILGRTSLFHCIAWGVLGTIFVKILLPPILKCLGYFEDKRNKVLTLIMMIFMSINILISWGAASRQDERTNHITANSFLDRFFDVRFPDERMDKIYSNKKVVRK